MLSSFTRALRRLRLLLTRRSFEHDLEEEMRFHMDMAAARHAANGHSPNTIRALLHKEFGPMVQYQDEVRDAHGLTMFDDLGRDLRFAFRGLLRTPGFTAVALITFALGVGVNAAMFSVVNAVLLRPLPYANASRMVVLNETVKDQAGPGAVSYMNFLDWRQRATSFEGMGAYYNSLITLAGDGSGEPERLRQGVVSANVLSMAGAAPALGRTFIAGEDERGKNRVTVLSHDLWQRRYAGDSAIVGRTISFEGTPHTVVGVMPAGFNFPGGSRQVELWVPFVPPTQALDPRSRGWHWMNVVGLLKPGVTVARADQEMKQIAQRIEQEHPQVQAGRGAIAIGIHDSVVGNTERMLFLLLGAVSLVLLTTCANVANLLLARNAARGKDVAVRVALGASRGQLIRHFLTESVVLAMLGATLGLAVSRLMLSLLTTVGAESLPIIGPIPIDWRVLAALGAAAVVSGLAFGIAPALQVSSTRLAGGLAGLTTKATTGAESRRFRNGLVMTQIALSLMLLIGAGLLMRGFVALRATDPGVVSERVLTARIAVPRRFLRDKIETDALLRPLLENVRAIPGVRFAGVTTMIPLDQRGASASFWVNGRPLPPPERIPLLEVRTASPGYIAAMGIPLKLGRDFTESDDTTGVRKAIVNEALVKLLLPGENPIGRRLLQGLPPTMTEYEIVGVIGDVKNDGLAATASPEVYTPYADLRIDWSQGDMSLVVKTAVPELSIVPQVRAAAKAVATDVALMNVRAMDEVVDRSLSGARLALTLFGVFAAVALLLAASGLFGVIYYLVTQRTREFGIRVALGAGMSGVVGMVMKQAAVLAAGGIAIGVVGALLLSTVIRGMLYGVGPRDPLTYVGVSAMLAAVAFLATLVPAWKATRVDPVIALREE